MSVKTGDHLSINLIQSFPVSCLNRDDNNDVKSAVIGGVDRTIISSQCQKYAIMQECKAILKDRFSGKRTREYPAIFAKCLIAEGMDEEMANAYGNGFVTVIGSKKSKDKKADAVDENEESEEIASDDLMGGINIFSEDELTAVAKNTMAVWTERQENTSADEKPSKKSAKPKKDAGDTIIKDIAKAIKQVSNAHENLNNAVNIALAGRMIAGPSGKNLRVDAAMAVMHSYSVHEVESQYDYFTAVDEISGESGAGMIGNTSFSSGTFYRSVNFDMGLLRNLDEKALKEGLRVAITAFIKALPVARQNSMFSATTPNFVFATYTSGDRPWQSSAFIKPIPVSEDGYEAEAIRLFREDFENYKKKFFTGKELHTYELSNDSDLSINEFIDGIMSNV